MISLLADNYYLLNLFFAVSYSSALLIYLGRFGLDDPRTTTFQRMLLGIIAWAFFDTIIVHIGRTQPPEIGFICYRYLSILFLFFPPAAGELILSLMQRVTWRNRFWLYSPFVLLYISAILLPDWISSRMFGISGGYHGSNAPWNFLFKAFSVGVMLTLIIRLALSARMDTDRSARSEKLVLCLGGTATLAGLILSQYLRMKLGPEFPWTANLAASASSLGAFWGIKRYGRILSPRALYSTTIRGTPNGMIHLQDGRITWANKSMVRLLGRLEPGELQGQWVTGILDKSRYNPMMITQIAENLTQGRLRDEEVYLADIKGDTIPCLANSASFDSKNPDQGALVVFTDVTEYKRMTEALETYHAKTRAILNAIPDMMFFIDRQGVLLDYYAEKEKELAVPPRKFLGKNIKDALPDLASKAGPYIEAAFLTGTLQTLEHTLQIQNTDRYLELRIVNSGEDNALAIVRDVTDRKQAEAALIESEEKFRQLYEESKKAEEVYHSLIQSSADAIVVYDMQGNAMYISPSFERIFGWTLDEVKGRRIPFVPDSEREATMTIIVDLVENGTPCQGFETKRYTKDGRILDISISASRYDDHEGNPAGMLVILRNITKTKALEAQLQQALKMEAVGTLASGIAHDFNNLLQAISGYVQLLQTRIGSSPTSQRYLSEVNLAVERASDLVQRLLTFGRKVEPKLRPVDLNQEVLQSVKILERTIPKMIRIETHLTDNLNVINADPNQLERVIMNLATNARDVMPEGGRLIIETENITLGEEYAKAHLEIEPGEYVVLKVSDTGLGMDHETIDRIYEPFFTTKGVGEGSGLGLSAVYGIVKGHGGHISCYSQPGQGTTFNIYFPITTPDRSLKTATDDKSELATPGGDETILLVDDEKSVLEIASAILEENGYTTLTAFSGEEALDVYKEKWKDIDLVVLDLGMPGMGGSGCLKEMLDINPRAKVIIASGYSAKSYARETLGGGAKDFISKPYPLGNMLRKVREVLDAED